MHLRQSIIDDEIWQADQPYGPFLLLQLLVFPELICAADQELCAYVCISEAEREAERGERDRERKGERETVSVCHCLCPQALHQHLSIPQYVRLEYENRKLFHHSATMCTYGHKAEGKRLKLSGEARNQQQSTQKRL